MCIFFFFFLLQRQNCLVVILQKHNLFISPTKTTTRFIYVEKKNRIEGRNNNVYQKQKFCNQIVSLSHTIFFFFSFKKHNSFFFKHIIKTKLGWTKQLYSTVTLIKNNRLS